MKSKLWIVSLVVLLGGGYLLAAHLSGGGLPTFGLPLGGTKSLLRSTARSFWEDLQFKDFVRAATYHSPEKQKSVDIRYLLWKIFLVKPEVLEILDYEILYVDLDSSRLRARVKCRVRYKVLGTGKDEKKVRKREVLLYFHRDSLTDPWYMKLEDSLRHIEKIEGKKI